MSIKSSKKIAVSDVDYIFEQIKSDFPPQTKEEHKVLNNVRVLFEKNVVAQKNDEVAAKKTEFIQLREKLTEKFLDLTFLRKELVLKFKEEYNERVSNKIKNTILYKINKQEEPFDYEKYKIKFSSPKNEEFLYSKSILPVLNSKLKKIKEIVEETCEGGKIGGINADKYAESYFRDL
ncbi:hypothetical protein NUSPORA_00827 [Nucleospora cyclopteri]